MQTVIEGSLAAEEELYRQRDVLQDALEKVVAAWDNGAGFALIEACISAKKTLDTL